MNSISLCSLSVAFIDVMGVRTRDTCGHSIVKNVISISTPSAHWKKTKEAKKMRRKQGPEKDGNVMGKCVPELELS